MHDTITRAKSESDALSVTGRLNPLDAHGVKIDYIKHVLGSRATSGYFEPTRKNVNVKFVKAWRTANGL